MKITEFKINYRKNPIDVGKFPVFCWQSDFKQVAYRITVSADGEKTFDSGRVESCENVGIEYDGKELVSDCYYNVELTVYGNIGEARAVSFFQTGLLKNDDWKGRWVSMPANFCGDALYVRHDLPDFDDREIKRAKCYVAGLGYHEAYVNGQKVGNAVLSPAFSDPSKRVNYVAYDITELLTTGKNVIGFILGNGWIGQKFLLVQLNVLFSDGGKCEFYTGKNMWWVRGGAIQSNSVYGGEVYDARLEFNDWLSVDHVPCWDNGWMYLLNALNAPVGELSSCNIDDIEVCDTFNAVAFKELSNGNIVYDFGYNVSGWCRIKVKGNRGDKVTMYFAEDIKPDGSVNRLNLRLAKNSDVYILKGDGEEEYAPRFTYHGFRYMQAEIVGNAEITEVKAEHVHTNVKLGGSFECSNDVLNKLHQMAVRTELNNLQGIMTDCPQRDERFMWLNDLSSRIFQSVNNCALERVLPKLLDDISDTSDDIGRIADTAPYLTAQRPADPVCVCYLLFALRCYELYGDKQTVVKHYDKMKKWVDYLISRSSNYQMDYFYYGDWVTPYPNGKESNSLYVSSAYLYWHITSIRKLAKICGKVEDYEYYNRKESEAKKAFNDKFYNPIKKCYGNDTQTENSIALSLGLAPNADRAIIAKRIADDIVNNGNHSTCGNQGYRHMFYALSDEGYTERLIQMITNKEYPGWGYMVACGATTVWERWEKEMQCEMHSFDHPMFASYDGWLYEYLGGIKVADDSFGCNKIIISPKITESVDYVNCSIDTIRGKIVSNWRKNGNCVEYQIEIPNGVTADIITETEKRTVGCGNYIFHSTLK